jgi:hypothetical protein
VGRGEGREVGPAPAHLWDVCFCRHGGEGRGGLVARTAWSGVGSGGLVEEGRGRRGKEGEMGERGVGGDGVGSVLACLFACGRYDIVAAQISILWCSQPRPRTVTG